jgi:hypothetical protein
VTTCPRDEQAVFRRREEAFDSMEDLKQLIRADARELEIKFSNASVQGRGTPQEISDFRENALQAFLEAPSISE